MVQLAFYAFAALSVIGAFAILFTRNVLYAAFFLLLTLLGVAGLFVLASADFLAIAQIMIYVGGVLVLVIFGVMLTHKAGTADMNDSQQPNSIVSMNRFGNGFGWIISSIVAGSLFVALFTLLVRADFVLLHQPVGWQSTIHTIGVQLMTTYIVPFEIVAVLLLATLIGATYLASPLAKSSRNAAR